MREAQAAERQQNRLVPPGRGRRLRPGRLAGAVGLGLALFGMGQFDEGVFALLTRAWQDVLSGLGPAQAQWVEPSGLSTHGVLVGLSYRLLYILLSIALLHVLLRGRHTRAIALGYGLAFGLSLVLLLLGQRAGLPLVSVQGHRLLDLLSSPLALVLLYGLILLRRPLAAASGS